MEVYLDHAATAPMPGPVRAALQEVLREGGGNPSSVHRAGAAARARIARARAELAALIGAPPDTLVFTSGASESNNAVLCGAGRRADCGRSEILTCATEHSSVLQPCARLTAAGVGVRFAPVRADGTIDPQAFRRELSERTLLASVMWVNNETGVIQPIAELAALAREHGALFHTDATAALGKLPLHIAALPIDFASFSAHKLGGPQGVGALYVRAGAELVPLVLGGDQEGGRRAGTENVLGIAGFGAACALARSELAESGPRIAALRDRLWQEIAERVPGVHRHGCPGAQVPHVLHVSFAGADGEALVEALDLAGIAVASGSACHAGSSEPSHVLLAMGVAPELSRAALRFSLGSETTRAQIDYVLGVLPEVEARVRVRRAAARRSAPVEARA
jgi:cysteine desulfurase